MIELKNVSFTYLSENSDESSAELNGSLSNIDLRIEKGSFVLLTGPSGCGKSTLLRLINGLIPHYYSGKLEGEVVIDGEPVNDKPLCKSAEKIGTVFQNPRSQFFNVDTTSELAFLSENLGVEAEIIKSRIKQTAESFGINNLMNRSIFHLSDGEKQKIACASIEVGKPEIILLDEPSANLDYHATMQLRKLIAQWVRQGRTVIAAEHRLFYLWDLIDRVVLMDDGKIIKDYNKNELNKLSDNDLSELGLRSAHSPAPTEIEFEDRAFDLATAFETVYFWPGLEHCFSEVYRVLKPGGVFMICNESDGTDETSLKYEKIIDGMKCYTVDELTSALKAAGFTQVISDRYDSKPWITVIARKD